MNIASCSAITLNQQHVLFPTATVKGNSLSFTNSERNVEELPSN